MLRFIYAFFTFRLDYCNIFFQDFQGRVFRGLLMVQNAAAPILTGSSKYDHIDSVLASLHWLRTQIQADFEVLLLTYEVVNGQAPSYLNEGKAQNLFL